MSETLAEKILRIRHDQNVSTKSAARVARAELRFEAVKAKRKEEKSG